MLSKGIRKFESTVKKSGRRCISDDDVLLLIRTVKMQAQALNDITNNSQQTIGRPTYAGIMSHGTQLRIEGLWEKRMAKPCKFIIGEFVKMFNGPYKQTGAVTKTEFDKGGWWVTVSWTDSKGKQRLTRKRQNSVYLIEP